MRRETPAAKADLLGEALAAINPDELSPKEALAGRKEPHHQSS
jgi:hypothetical protein